MIRFKRMFVLLFWAAVLVLPAADALAILKDLGPTDAAHGYPVWYRDFSTNVSANGQNFPQGLPLELCDSQTQNANGYLCNLLPEDPDPAIGAPGYDPALPRDFTTNFPHESFYFMADAAMTPAGGDFSDAGITIGLEAAFGGDVADGNQITFARVRVRVDVDTPGTYRVTHPYGVLIFPDVPAGTRTINYTEDIGIGNPGEFTGALAGKVGPFLTWDTEFPIVIGDEVFIGDPAIPHTITGSPFGTNFFRIERIDALGNTLSSVETDQFNLTGKIYTTPIASPLKGTRASYVRNAAEAHIFVFAEADVVSNSPPSLSSLEASATGVPAVLMTTDGNGNFFAHLTTAADALPTSVTITNLGDVPPTTIGVPLVDEVSVEVATYNSDTQVLTLNAVSSDSFAPPSLSTIYGPLIDGQLIVAGLQAPMPAITVTSSANGQDTEQIEVTSAGIAGGQILSPNGGEILLSGTEVNVEWADFPADAVRYRLFYFDPDNMPHLVDTVFSANSYVWSVPTVAATQAGYRFRVTAFDAANNKVGVALSEAPFTIEPNPALMQVVSPNNNEVLTSGSVFNVEWTPAVGAASYRLFYFDGDGTPHAVASVRNATSYAWTVPVVATEESGKRFRVTAFDAANNRIGVDFSDTPFTIQPALLP